MPDTDALTERQQKWFASVKEGLERETGRSLDEWAELARACPETAPRKRQAWMKATFGLGQNRAMMVLNAAFPPAAGTEQPDALAEALWADPDARTLHEAVRRLVTALPDVIIGQRKGYTAYSRRLQFCAARPWKQGVLLGLALDPSTDTALRPSRKPVWSERLLSEFTLQAQAEVSPHLSGWLKAAWERS